MNLCIPSFSELNNRAAFIDFCQGLLNLNPVTRWTPQQARLHPFITGEKFTKPFVVCLLFSSSSCTCSYLVISPRGWRSLLTHPQLRILNGHTEALCLLNPREREHIRTLHRTIIIWPSTKRILQPKHSLRLPPIRSGIHTSHPQPLSMHQVPIRRLTSIRDNPHNRQLHRLSLHRHKLHLSKRSICPTHHLRAIVGSPTRTRQVS